MIILLATVLLALGVFYGIVTAPIGDVLKFILVLVEMFLVGRFLIDRYKLAGEHGIIMLKSTHGLKLIDSLASRPRIFSFLSDAGAVASYGLLSIVLMRRNVSLKSFIAGLALLSVLHFIIMPYALAIIITFLGLGASPEPVSVVPQTDLVFFLVLALIYSGGMFLFLLLGLLGYGVLILSGVLSDLLSGTDQLAQLPSGGTLLLPGVNLPLFEGVIALFIVLVVHEAAHAILARIARVPVLSSGIVLFGVIPIGAFVEPDEAALRKADQHKQTRVLVAGSTSNFITCLVFFILFIGFFYGTSMYREEGLLVLAGMEKNTVIYAVDGTPVDTTQFPQFNFSKNTDVILSTNKGELVRTTNENGRLGVILRPITRDSIFSIYSVPAFQFIFNVLGLVFALNVIIGSVNLLPLPFFDGYRTLDTNITNKKVVSMLMALTLVAFVINFLPALFK